LNYGDDFDERKWNCVNGNSGEYVDGGVVGFEFGGKFGGRLENYDGLWRFMRVCGGLSWLGEVVEGGGSC
jgi:hypothetical protein